MSGRGRRAALPADGHARPEYLVADGQGGLVVRHYDREGRVREYDFTQLRVPAPMQASLAALFAARCTPDRWSAHDSSEGSWLQLRRFAQFLACQEPSPRDLGELTPAMVRRWRAWLSAGAGGYYAFGLVSSLLLDDDRLQAGPVADELARRSRKPRSRTQFYSEAEFDRVTAAARRRFRAAWQRINDNALRLQQWRDGALAEGSGEWIAGEGLDILARTGDLPRYARKDGQPSNVEARYRNAFGTVAWQRLFLTREEAVALGVLLLAEFGWNLSVISSLEVPLASPDQGDDGHPTYRIPLQKHRRGPRRHHETRNVTDHGAGLARAADHAGTAGHALRPRHRGRARPRHRSADRLAGVESRGPAAGPVRAPRGRPVPLRHHRKGRGRLGGGRGAGRQPVPARPAHRDRA